jgi:hypothetical protein
MTDNHNLDMYIAHTQARITYGLMGAFTGLMFALLAISIIALKVDDKILSILDRIVTAMLPIVGGAIGFWTARQRQAGVPDPSTTSSTTTTTTLPSPLVVPAGSTIVPAPGAPQAIIPLDSTQPGVKPP